MTRKILFNCFALLFSSSGLFAQSTISGNNIIRQENEKPGTTDWIITKVIREDNEHYESGWNRRKAIEGYVSKTSIRVGETLDVFVSTDPDDSYSLDIYRMGYYGGKGGRLVKSIPSLEGTKQPTPGDGNRYLIECKWKTSASIQIPADWVSGVYLGKLTTRNTHAQAYIIFIVRDDRKADLLFQCSDLTWLAYNRWPKWRSLYDTPTDQWAGGTKNTYDVGFDRPYALYWNGFPAGFEPLTNGSGEFLMTEFPMAFWLEREGYDVTYISNVDTHADAPSLLRGKVFLSVGHDEYWTQQMFDNVSKARDEGLNLAFFSGNSVSGRVELLPATDGSPNRVIRYVDRFKNEEELMGANSYGVGLASWKCVAPDHWVFEGTGMKKGDSIRELVGWEYHGLPVATGKKDLVILAKGKVHGFGGEPSNREYAATIYT
ncbi:MAG TPA: N,N-dimethylformamidase beta subunit family domain-containing protein, partial [Puia sp.]|nr:N,N-dimethylformamidase beta subunit family domain-containing protein [Puia sp.]